MIIFDKKIRECHKIYNNYIDLITKLEEKIIEEDNVQINKKELKKLEIEFENFKINQYAKVVFEKYSSKNPKLRFRRSGRIVYWNEYFKNEFELHNDNDKIAMISLIEPNGAFEKI